MRAFVRNVAIVLATGLVTMSLVLWVTVHAFSAAPGEWSVPIRFGVLGWGPTMNASVTTLMRAATQPLGRAVLDGRAFEVRGNRLAFARGPDDALVVTCAPCAMTWPGLGAERVTVTSMSAVARWQVDRLAGTVQVGEVGGQFVARPRSDGVTVDLDLDQAPIAAYYRVFGDRVPETRVARIDGTASFRIRLAWPEGTSVVTPSLDGFAVSGLGTELLAGRMPDVTCAAEASRARAGAVATRFGTWLPRAVVAAEDQRYDEHPGYDLVELGASLSRNAGTARVERGGSTIPQQLARLLYVGSERSPTRKLRELLYAVEMERTLGKARMLQLYLAVAPWGEGVCGAEAAAQRYFGRPAAKLDGAQAVWLAAMLHAPDSEFDHWQVRGGIDLVRARWVVMGLRRTTRATKDRLVDGLAALAPQAQPLVVATPPAAPVTDPGKDALTDLP